MKCLKKPLARLANRQDETRGAFLKGGSYCLRSPCLTMTTGKNTVGLALARSSVGLVQSLAA